MRDGQTASLCMGWPNIAYNDITPSGVSYFLTYDLDKNGETVLNKEETTKPYLNYGSTNEKWWDKNNNVISGDTISNWIKRVSTHKTNSNDIFSNNIFVTSGRKVLWGPGQNEEDIKDEVYCTELENIKEGYSLDDDASYWPSNSVKYSALAVDGSVVGGDYFAILSGGTIISGSTVKKWTNYCGGIIPASDTGYVLKTLPEEELYLYTYTGKKLEKPEGYSGDGVYYSTFEYPVIEKNFDVQAKFYIWSEYGIDGTDSNNSSFPNLKFEEMAGRTELKVSGGIKYNKRLDKFGSSNLLFNDRKKNIVSFIDNSVFENFTGDNLIVSGVSGMNVTVLSEDEDGNEIYERFQAYEGKYAVGVTGVTDVYYDIKEGYPINDKKYADLVNNKSWSVNYDSYFAQNVGYEIKPGRGLDVFTIGEGGNGSGEGMICCFKKSSITGNDFIQIPTDGNAKYVYIKQGSSVPTYYILCKYKESEDREDGDNEVFEGGGFTFLRIRYFNKRRFYQEYYNLKGDFVQNGKHKKAKSIRNNIAALLDRNKDWETYMTTVDATRINCNQKSWEEQILSGSSFYETNKNNIFSGSVINSQYIVYYVDMIKENNNVLYKIYPSFNELNKNDDGISLNLYRFEGPFSADTPSSTAITLTCELNKKDFSASTITQNDIEAFNGYINFETNNGGDDTLEVISANASGNTSAITYFSNVNIVSTDFYNLNLSSSTVNIVSGDTDDSGNTEYSADVTLNFNLTIKDGKEGDAIDKKIDQIYFYLTNKKNGERLDVVRRSAGGGKEIIFSKTPDGSEPITSLTFNSVPSSKDIYILYEKRNGVINPHSLTTTISGYIPFLVGINIKKDNYTTFRKKDETGDNIWYYSVPCVINANLNITSYEETITVSGQGLKSGKLTIIGNINEEPKIVFLNKNEKETIDSIELFMIPNTGYSSNSSQYIIVYNNTGEECELVWVNKSVGLKLEKDEEKVSKSRITYYKVVQTDMGHDPYPKYESMEYPSSNIIKIQNNNEIGSSLNVVIKPYCMFKINNTITNEYINDFKILIVFDPYSEYKDYYKETYLRTENQPTYYEKYHVLFESSDETQEKTIVPPIPYNSSDIPFEISIISGTIPDKNVKGFGCIMLGKKIIMDNMYGSGITSSNFDAKEDNIGIGLNQGEVRSLRLANLYDNFKMKVKVIFKNDYEPPQSDNFINKFDGYMIMYQKIYGSGYNEEIFRCNNSGTSIINYQSGDGYEDLCRLNIAIYHSGTNIDFKNTPWFCDVKIESLGGAPIYENKKRISNLVDNENPIISIDDIRISSLFTASKNIKIIVTFKGEK